MLLLLLSFGRKKCLSKEQTTQLVRLYSWVVFCLFYYRFAITFYRICIAKVKRKKELAFEKKPDMPNCLILFTQRFFYVSIVSAINFPGFFLSLISTPFDIIICGACSGRIATLLSVQLFTCSYCWSIHNFMYYSSPLYNVLYAIHSFIHRWWINYLWDITINEIESIKL